MLLAEDLDCGDFLSTSEVCADLYDAVDFEMRLIFSLSEVCADKK